MPNIVKILKSVINNNRPTGHTYGEPYVNFAESQFGVVNSANTPVDLLMVTAFSAGATYSVGDYVWNAGVMYRCVSAVITPGAFNATNWSAVATAATLAAGYLPLSGGTLNGDLTVSGTTGLPLKSIAPNGTDGRLQLTLTGTGSWYVGPYTDGNFYVSQASGSPITITGANNNVTLSNNLTVGGSAQVNSTIGATQRITSNADIWGQTGLYGGSGSPQYFHVDGSGNVTSAGSITATTMNCPTYYNNPTFTGSVQVNGNLSTSGSFAAGSIVNVGSTGICFTAYNTNYRAANFFDSVGYRLFVNGGDFNYVPYGYAVSGATQNILSWGYNTNGNVYASMSGGQGQRVWSTSASDRRLKSNIQKPTVDALEVVNKLNIVSADMQFPKGPLQHWDFALIADEVEPLIPRAFIPPIDPETGEPDLNREDAWAALNPLPLITTLVRAVQQLTEKVETLEAELATHKRR